MDISTEDNQCHTSKSKNSSSDRTDLPLFLPTGTAFLLSNYFLSELMFLSGLMTRTLNSEM